MPHELVNLNTTLIPTDKIGSCVNGTCDGVFGSLQSHEADYVVGQVSAIHFTDFILQFVDVVGGVREQQQTLATSVSNLSKSSEDDTLSTLLVYSNHLYISFYLLMTAIVIVLAWSSKLSKWDTIWEYYSVAMSQGWLKLSKKSNRLSFRVWLLTLLIPTFLLITIGCNMIHTELVSVQYPPFINSLADILRFGRKMIFLHGTGSIERFQGSKYKIRKQLWERKGNVIAKSSDTQYIIDMIQHHGYVLADNRKIHESLTRLACQLQILGEHSSPSNNIYISPPYSTDMACFIMRRSAKLKELKRRLEMSLRLNTENGIINMCLDDFPRRLAAFILGGDLATEVNVDKCVARKPYKNQNIEEVHRITFKNLKRLLYTMAIAILFIIFYQIIMLAIQLRLRKRVLPKRIRRNGWGR